VHPRSADFGEASKDLRGRDVIALAQFSIAATAPLVMKATGRPVVTARAAPSRN
jgi:hypothetical protein